LAPSEPVDSTAATIKDEPESEQLSAEETGGEAGGSVSNNSTSTTSYTQETATDAEQSLMKMQLRK